MTTVKRAKPFPDPHAQLRAFQRNEVASAFGDNAPLRFFSVGIANPTPQSPTMAMAALGELLDEACPIQGWMVLPFEGQEACTDHVRRVARRALLGKSPIAAIGGDATAVAFWVFHDLSAILTERRPEGLRLYPTAMHMRSQDPGWVPKMLLGRAQEPAHLRITPLHRGPENPTEDKPTPVRFLENDLLVPPGTHVAPDDAHASAWASALRMDADRYAPAFAKLQGHALWPHPERPYTEEANRQQSKPSQWPASLPRRGIAEANANVFSQTMDDAATWIQALRTSQNLPFLPIGVNQHGAGAGEVYINLLESVQAAKKGDLPRWRVLKSFLLRDVQGNFGNAFPEPLAERLRQAVSSSHGLRYVSEGTGIKPSASSWFPCFGLCETPLSAHGAMKVFARLGVATPDVAHLWKAAFKGL